MNSEHVERDRLLDSADSGETELEEVHAIPCHQMTRFIVLHAIRRVPLKVRDRVEFHMRECEGCRKKRLALTIASKAVSQLASDSLVASDKQNDGPAPKRRSRIQAFPPNTN